MAEATQAIEAYPLVVESYLGEVTFGQIAEQSLCLSLLSD